MQLVTGPRTRPTTMADIAAWAECYERVVLDLGTGDGRFVLDQARSAPAIAAIGVDLCPANIRIASRKAGANARFLVADACTLPEELIAMVDHVNIAFPWGRLLRGVLDEGNSFLPRLVRAMHPGATLSIVINGDGSESCGLALTEATSRIVTALSTASAGRPRVTTLSARELRTWPSTWAKRLAFGRNPHAVAITAIVSPEPRRSFGTMAELAPLYHPERGPMAALRS